MHQRFRWLGACAQLVAICLMGLCPFSRAGATCGDLVDQSSGYFAIQDGKVTGTAHTSVCQNEGLEVSTPLYDSWTNGEKATVLPTYLHQGVLPYEFSRYICPGNDGRDTYIDDDWYPASGSLFQFSWNMYCGNEVPYAAYVPFAEKYYLVLDEDWDPPCETCIGGSENGVCQHATASSLVYEAEPDLVLKSATQDITLQRTYRTSHVDDGRPSLFGAGWHTILDRSVKPLWTSQRVYNSDANSIFGYIYYGPKGKRTYYFRRFPAGFSSGNAVDYDSQSNDGSVLSASGSPIDTIVISGRSGEREIYGLIGGSWRITRREEVFGQGTTFSYTDGRLVSFTDPLGRSVFFEYTGNHISEVIGPAGHVATYGYTGDNLTRVEYSDGSGYILEYVDSRYPAKLTGLKAFDDTYTEGRYFKTVGYDETGRVKTVSEGPTGRSYENNYAPNQTTAVEWVDSNWNSFRDPEEAYPDPVAEQQYTTIYEIHSLNGADTVTRVTGAGCGCSQSTQYGDKLLPLITTDRNGVATSRTYDAQGNVLSLVEGVGVEARTTTYDYAYAPVPQFPGHLARRTTALRSVVDTALSKTTTEIFDLVTGKLTDKIERGKLNPESGNDFVYTTSYAYDESFGGLRSVTGPNPNSSVIFEYYGDQEGDEEQYSKLLKRKIEENGASDIVTEYLEYDGYGNATRIKDANGNETVLAFNARGQLLSREEQVGTPPYPKTSYTYGALGKLRSVTSPNGNAVSYAYDGQGRLEKITDGAGNYTKYTYLRGDRVKEEVYEKVGATFERRKSEDYHYNSQHLLDSIIKPDGAKEVRSYDGNGNAVQVDLYEAADATVASRTTVNSYTQFNQLEVTELPGDQPGSRVQVSYLYDGQGNLSKVTDASGLVTQYDHDDMGRVTAVSSSDTGTTRYEHDAAGNVLKRTDADLRVTDYSCDTLGRLTGIAYDDQMTPAVVYRYDTYSPGGPPNGMGRLTGITDGSGSKEIYYDHAGRVTGTAITIDAQQPYEIGYQYNKSGILTHLTYPSGRQVVYEIDKTTNNVKSVTSALGSVTTLAENISNLPFGPLRSMQYVSGLVYSRDPEDNSFRPRTISLKDGSVDVLQPKAYLYDKFGNVNSVSGADYTYFPTDRLWTWTTSEDKEVYTYDLGGNRTKMEDGKSSPVSTDYFYIPDTNVIDVATGFEAAAYDHDEVGNIVARGSQAFTHDMEGRLVAASDPTGAVSYVYNADGQRMKKTVGQKVTYYLYDLNGHLIHESTNTNGPQVDYVYLHGEPLAKIETDSLPPVFKAGDPQIIRDSQTQLRVQWTTDEESDSHLEYGTTSSYGTTVGDDQWTTDHSITVSGLDPAAGDYFFLVKSTDLHGNYAIKEVAYTLNEAPEIVSSRPSTATVDLPADGLGVFEVVASDPNVPPDPALTYSWNLNGVALTCTAPACVIDTSAASWVTNPSQDLTVIVSDGARSASRTWAVVSQAVVLSDNVDSSTTWTGSWTSSATGSGFYGSDYKYHSAGTAATFTWSPTVPSEGHYRVYARWRASSSYTTNASYKVTYAGGKYDLLTADQTTRGGGWNLLGTYYFLAGVATIKLSLGANESGVADAVKLVGTTDPADVIVDDADGPPLASKIGSWSVVPTGGFRGQVTSAPAGSGAAQFSWNPGGLQSGSYEVSAWWPTGSATNAKYVVQLDPENSSQSTRDQTLSGGQWNVLGRYFLEEEGAAVTLNDNINATQTVYADAVKFVYLGQYPVEMVDNAAPCNTSAPAFCFSEDGWTTTVSPAGYVGADGLKIVSGSDGAWAEWLLPVSTSATYEVYVNWTSYPARSSNVRYEVVHAGGVETVMVDQKSGGGTWNYLGRYQFASAEGGKVRVLQAPDGTVCADAVMAIKTDEDLPIVVDNSDAGHFGKTGTQWSALYTPLGYQGEDFLVAPASGGRTATWTPLINTTGNYDVYVRWIAAASRSTQVPYLVHSSDDEGNSISESVGRNQSNGGGAWAKLGRYRLLQGSTASVTVSSSTGGTTAVDAARFDYTLMPLPIIVDNASAPPGFTSSGCVVRNTLAHEYPDDESGDYARGDCSDAGNYGRWTLPIDYRGYYKVYLWWPQGNSTFTTNGRVEIAHALGTSTVNGVNFQGLGNDWHYLGTYLFDVGSSKSVKVKGYTGCSGEFIADAVKLEREGK